VQRAAYASPVFELFALHARFGPLRDFARDVETYAVYLAEPQVLYALARTYARGGDALSSTVCERAASAVSLRATRRLRVADFLRQSGWGELAERELLAVVATEPAADAVVDHVNARLHLATIAADRKDDRATAGHLRAVLELVETNRLQLERTDDTGRRLPFDAGLLRGQIAWHDFRAARDAGELAAAEKHLAELLVLKPTTSRVVLDVVPHLKSVGRERDAQALFEHAYAFARQRLDAAPDDAGAMNELAWLCARAGERLDEALELATRATTIAPANASYLDTAAEANFQVGRIDEAIRLEQAAVELEPTNAFMREQLERFEAARKR
jgi:tetratricopeptide (TPR) repeat protein